MLLATIGLVLGLFVSFGSTHLASSFLYGVNPSDPVIFVGVTVLLAGAALCRVLFPSASRTKDRSDYRVALRIAPLHCARSKIFKDAQIFFGTIVEPILR